MKFSAQTAVLPELSREQVLQKLKAHGYDGVEWRVHEDYHIAPTELLARAGEIHQRVSATGLEVTCLMGYAPLHDLGEQRRFAEACAIMSCPRYRPGAARYDGSRNYHDVYRESVDQLARVIEAIAPFGVKPIIETHFGTIASSASLTHRLVQNFDPGAIGVNYDPANLIIEGREDYRLGLELLGPYLDYVHAKNVSWFRRDGRWRWEFDAMDSGQVDWGEVMPLLRAVGYDGYVSFENFYQVPMRSRGFIGEDLTQHLASYRDIDVRLAEDLAYLKRCLA